MIEAPAHIIHSLKLDIDTRSNEIAHRLKGEVSDFVNNELQEYLESLFTDLTNDEYQSVIKIEQLIIPVETSIEELKSVLKEEIGKEIKNCVERPSANGGVHKQTRSQSDVAAFWEVVEKGTLPWWKGASNGISFSEASWLKLISEPAFQIGFSQRIEDAFFRKQLVQQCTSSELLDLVDQLAVIKALFNSLSSDIKQRIEKLKGIDKTVFWYFLLEEYIHNRLAQFTTNYMGLVFAIKSEISIQHPLFNLGLLIAEEVIAHRPKDITGIEHLILGQFSKTELFTAKEIQDLNTVNNKASSWLLEIHEKFHRAHHKASYNTIHKAFQGISQETSEATSEKSKNTLDHDLTKAASSVSEMDKLLVSKHNEGTPFENKEVGETSNSTPYFLDSKAQEQSSKEESLLGNNESKSTESEINVTKSVEVLVSGTAIDAISEQEKDEASLKNEVSKNASITETSSLSKKDKEKSSKSKEVFVKESFNSSEAATNSDEDISKWTSSKNIEADKIAAKETEDKASSNTVKKTEIGALGDQSNVATDQVFSEPKETKEDNEKESKVDQEAIVAQETIVLHKGEISDQHLDVISNKNKVAKDEIGFKQEVGESNVSEDGKNKDNQKKSLLQNTNARVSQEHVEENDIARRYREYKKQLAEGFSNIDHQIIETPLKEEDQQAILSNAGLILIHPYIKIFFDNCGFYDNDSKEIVEKSKAVHALHYIATKTDCDWNANVSFEKFLCGIPLNVSIPREVELDEEVKKQSEELLKAVIENWPALKNSSTDLLRHEFLQRPGKLDLTGKTPRITIERKTQDILLDKISWNLSIAKLPWIDALIYTDW